MHDIYIHTYMYVCVCVIFFMEEKAHKGKVLRAHEIHNAEL